MENLEETIDKSIEYAIDQVIQKLNENQHFDPFCFLIQHDGCFTDVVPTETDFRFDETYMTDSFKDFGNDKLEENFAEGYGLITKKEITLNDEKQESICIFLKFQNDWLPLKTRIYYFPYLIIGRKPSILFDRAFASEG